MADNASGFVDFNQFYAANKDAEDAALQQALAQAQQYEGEAQRQLVRSRTQAMDQGLSGISQAGSYTDYLAAKQKAQAAYQAAQNGGMDPRMAAVRQRLATEGDVAGRASSSASDLATREKNLGSWVEESYAGAQTEKAKREEYARKQQEAAAARAQENAKAQADYRAALQKRAQAYWQAEDKDRALNFSPFRTHGKSSLNNSTAGWKRRQWAEQEGYANDPNTDSYYANAWGTSSDAERLDQQLRAAGMNSEADAFSSNAEYEWGKRKSGGL